MQQSMLRLSAVQETVEWLARPENYDPDRTPPGLEDFDPVPFLVSSLPITVSVMATQLAHELGHRVVAFQKKARPANLMQHCVLATLPGMLWQVYAFYFGGQCMFSAVHPCIS